MFYQRHMIFALFACAAALGAYAAHADDGGGTARQPDQITWDEFKYRCADSKDKPLNEQGRPEHIRLQCTNVEREFVPASPGTLQLEATRHVVTTVLSDKFDVAAMGKDYAPASVAQSRAPCLRYKEVERTIQVEKSLSCGEILGIKGDINDYCASALDMIKGTSPKLVETRETGNVRDTCGSGGDDGGKK
jgi:hypothetical protein